LSSDEDVTEEADAWVVLGSAMKLRLRQQEVAEGDLAEVAVVVSMNWI
jgi:hypothetical protein